MKGNIEERVHSLAVYIVENRATVRGAAEHFGISKSTVHKDITYRLKQQNNILYEQVKEVLWTNKMERHIRGGMATKEKYMERRKKRRTEDME